jgi:hypothetical protein
MDPSLHPEIAIDFRFLDPDQKVYVFAAYVRLVLEAAVRGGVDGDADRIAHRRKEARSSPRFDVI